MKPFGSNILVVKDDDEKKSESGLILMGETDENLWRATVVGVGEGDLLVLADGRIITKPMRVKVGDKIVCSNFASTEGIKDGDQLVHVMPEHEVRIIL